MSNPDPRAQDDRGRECPNCGDIMRLIPAGISRKTGKPYRAFPVCDKADCKAIKEQSRYNVPPSTKNAPQASFDPSQAILTDLQTKIDSFNLTISEIRKWAVGLEKRMQGLESIAAFVESKQATELHSSFAPIDVKEPSKKFDFGKAKEILQDPNNIKIETPPNL